MRAKLIPWEIGRDGRALVIQAGARGNRVRPWDDGLEWLRFDGDAVSACVPEVAVLDPVGAANPWPLLRKSRLFLPDDAGVGWLPPTTVAVRRAVANALAAIIDSAPGEIRRLVAPFDGAQWALLQAAHQQPALPGFLATEYATGWQHYVFAGIVLSDFGKLEAAARRAVIEKILFRPRRQVLEQFSGMACSRASLRCLAFLGPRPASAEIYRAVLADPREGFRHHLLAQADGNASLTHRIAEATTLDALRALSFDVRRWENSLAAWQLMPALLSRCFPSPPLLPGGGVPLEPLASPEAIREEAARMGNCLGSLIDRAARHRSYYYRWSGKERATVEVVVHRDRIAPGEMKGYRNKLLKPETEAAILKALESCRPRFGFPPFVADGAAEDG